MKQTKGKVLSKIVLAAALPLAVLTDWVAVLFTFQI